MYTTAKKGDGQGNINHWGYSPAIDLKPTVSSKNDKPTVVLLNTGDPRNLLYTLWNSKSKSIKFQVVESQYELLARQILLLAIALDRHNYSLKEKVSTYLEIFGNSMVRSVTVERLDSILNTIIQALTDPDYKSRRLTYFNFSRLRQKDVDALENIFVFWRTLRSKSAIDISEMWDFRVRNYLGGRYDYSDGTFDWDLNMRLKDDLKVHNVTKIEFNRWRKSGIAFANHIEGDYKSVNRTLVSGKIFSATNSRDKSYRSGYWGDIITGPFVCFGIDSKNKDLLKTQNTKPMYSSETISEFNLSACFYEIQHPGLVYRDNSLEPNSKNSKNEPETIVEIDESELETEETSKTEKTKYKDGSCLINLENCEIEFHTNDSFLKESKFDRLDKKLVTYCSIVVDQKLLSGVIENSEKVFFETPSYLYDLKGEEFEKNWRNRIDEIVNLCDNKLKLKQSNSELKDYILYC